MSCVYVRLSNYHFQFTTSQGGRRVYNPMYPVSDPFQFTTSQGGRPMLLPHFLRNNSFQFTTSQGGRPFHFCLPYELSPGIPCLRLAGSTFSFLPPLLRNILSIHDLTRRSTEDGSIGTEQYYLSIHDLTRRSTLYILF